MSKMTSCPLFSMARKSSRQVQRRSPVISAPRKQRLGKWAELSPMPGKHSTNRAASPEMLTGNVTMMQIRHSRKPPVYYYNLQRAQYSPGDFGFTVLCIKAWASASWVRTHRQVALTSGCPPVTSKDIWPFGKHLLLKSEIQTQIPCISVYIP